MGLTTRRLVLLLFVVLWCLIVTPTALGQTNISSGTVYTSNVTWTASGSPYVVSGLRIAFGATLTINPGVVVKMNGQSAMMTVEGTLAVSGSAINPVVFTSVQDDSVDGIDSGHDGPPPGQLVPWYSIRINAPGSYASTFDYAEVRYGGSGSSDNGYGALDIAAGIATVTHSRFHHNQRSAIYVHGTGEGDVSKTRLDHNANGATAIGGVLNVNNSVIDHNSDTGIYYNYATAPAAQSVTLASRIADNAMYGIWFNVASSIAASLAPVAHRSNIFRNGSPNANGIYPAQLYISQIAARYDIDWSNNYWGTWGGGNAVNANPCSGATPPKSPWHLAYGPYSTGDPYLQVAPGPVSFSIEVISYVWPGTFCGSDKVDDYPYATKPFEIDYISTFSPLLELGIAKGLTPFLKFDSSERWTPLLLDSFFSESEGSEGAHKFCPNPGSTDDCTPLTSLGQWTTLGQADTDGFLNINDTFYPGTSVTDEDYYRSLYVVNGTCTPAWSGLHECGDPAHSALYYNLTTVEGADGYLTARSYWDFWWFYRYNDALSTQADHEGDWEGMTVVTPAALDPDIGPTDQILYVIYAQHSGTYRQLPGTYDVAQGTHPVGYPANGTHATYPATCDPSTTCWNDSNEPEGSHDGSRPWSANSCDSCLYPLPEADLDPLTLPEPAGWNALSNQWGSTFNGVQNFVSSPHSPGRQDRYLAPWAVNGGPSPPPPLRRTQGRGSQRGVCANWFGGSVVALLCDASAASAASRTGILGGRHKGTYHIRLAQPDARYGSTFGLAQAVGQPLHAGAKLQLIGQFPVGVDLKIRTQVSGKLAVVTFRLPHLRHGAQGILTASKAPERPAYKLTLRDRASRPLALIPTSVRFSS